VKRREGLALLAGVSPAFVTACGPKPPPDRRVRVAQAELRARGRLVVQYAGEPVELSQGDAGPVARSLLCTHFGCRVRWHAEQAGYRCTCHEATFDAEGRPLTGPATRPLRLLPVELADRDILVGER